MEILYPKIIIFFQIVFIDIVMAADNAIIIGLIASSFAKTDRNKIILLGVFGAFIFRVIFAAITVQLLQFPILTKQQTPTKPKKPPSFTSAVYSVIIADVTLSFDNVLGVAAAAKNEIGLLIFGLLLSVLLVGTVATYFANYIKGHKWVGVLGLVVILIVAVQLILGGTNEIYPNVLPEFLIKII